MNMVNQYQSGLPAVLLAALIVAAPAHAGPDSDTLEVNAYRLTEAGLARYSQATDGLARVLADNPALCNEDADAETLDAMAARIDSIPSASTAVRAAGMDSREYAVFTMSLVHSALGAWMVEQGGELPPDVALENVQFFQAHEMELKEVIERSQSMACDGEEDYGDEDSDRDEDESREEDGEDNG